MIEHLALWGLTPGRPRTDIVLPGSPERCVSRLAIEDDTGRVWMLEQLYPGQFDRRERIGRTLASLEEAGLPIPAYRPGPNGRFVVEDAEHHWQLSPYVKGDPLPQPDFIDDPERGTNLGNFIAALRDTGSSIREFDTEPVFILEDYINELMGAIGPRRPEIHQALLPVLGCLAPLFEAWPNLPATLCQGDFHPLNVIWRDSSVAAVIDWEFTGIRPAMFDVANCFGCVGMEDPMGLVRGLAPAMLRTLRDKGCLDKMSLTFLPEMIIGMRFAWMSEWLRKYDEEMAELEVRFMRLMINSVDTLLPTWEKQLDSK